LAAVLDCRDRALVMKDLRQDRISKRSAIEDYGLTPEEVEAALFTIRSSL
jgi:hypothetical protein